MRARRDASGRSPPRRGPDMRVPARVFADEELLDAILADRSLEQLAERRDAAGDRRRGARACRTSTRATASRSAASRRPSCPTASSRPAASATTSTAACGCSRCRSQRTSSARRVEPLVHELSRAIPAGTGKRGALRLAERGARPPCSREGPRALVAARGIGTDEDVERTESEGCLAGRRPGARSPRARTSAAPASSARSAPATTSSRCSGSTRVFDAAVGRGVRARARDRLTVLIHSGSRGLGHQVCTDYVRADGRRHARATASRSPTGSSRARRRRRREGQRLPRRDGAAANFAFGEPARDGARRSARRSRRVLGAARRRRHAPGLRRRPQHRQARAARRPRRLRPPQGRDARVPRRLGRDPGGVPRASASRSSSPAAWAPSSFVLAGEPGSMERSFGTTCHGAGRAMSRTARAQADHRRRAPRGSSRRKGSSSAARRTRGWPRRRRSPTRTSSASSRSSSGPGSRAASRGCGRSASSRAE